MQTFALHNSHQLLVLLWRFLKLHGRRLLESPNDNSFTEPIPIPGEAQAGGLSARFVAYSALHLVCFAGRLMCPH